jgi:hypothetical protein
MYGACPRTLYHAIAHCFFSVKITILMVVTELVDAS